MKRDLKAYHESLGKELEVLKDRVRQLISSSHWPTDGLHKEAVLRKVLSNHLPESLRIGTGFVCFSQESAENKLNSRQIDILITRRNGLTLFKDDILSIVTPDAVECIIEVKTKLDSNSFFNAALKIADDIEMVRKSGNSHCVAGIFVYDYDSCLSHDKVLRSLAEAARSSNDRAIDIVAVGNDRFYRFWKTGSPSHKLNSPAWHAYNLSALAHSYFISNIAWGISNSEDEAQFAWFPLEEGKETYLASRRSLLID